MTTPTAPSWKGTAQDVLNQALSNTSALRRLVLLMAVTATALGVLLGVLWLCGGSSAVWLAVGGLGTWIRRYNRQHGRHDTHR
jgi:hypothetical protein